MGKTLNHYSQQIKALAPDSLALDRARELGLLLLEAKAAVVAAGRSWGEWLENDCALSTRTAQRFMAIASRWDEPAFAEARQQRPDLPLREADRVLAASSTRKRAPRKRSDCEARTSGATTVATGWGDHVSYYCPACDTPYACTWLEKKPVLRRLLCAGSLQRPHPPTETVPGLLTVGEHQVKLKPLDTSSCGAMPAVAALLQQVCPPLITAGYKNIQAELTGVGGSLTIRGDTGADETLPPNVYLYLDNGLVKSVFLGQASSGNVLHATRGGYECRGASGQYTPLWKFMRRCIPWAGDQPPAPTAPAPLPVVLTLSDGLQIAGEQDSPQPGGLDPLQAHHLPDAVAAAVAAHGAAWPRGLAAKIAQAFGVSSEAVRQRKVKALVNLLDG